GFLGKLYYEFGFHNLYSSWWYLLLIALIGISLVICSLDRVVPLYKALKMQRPKRHETFVTRQRLFSQTENVATKEVDTVKKRFEKQGYKINEEDGQVVAVKGRFSRRGPYVNHIVLIIILLTSLFRLTQLFFLVVYFLFSEVVQIVIPDKYG